MTEHHSEIPAVDTLLAERDALHGWLAKLNAAGVPAPDSVRERVRLDYQHRLDGVTNALRAHASTIAERLDADRVEHDELAGQATTAREALAEAELRHAVGEYDTARFQTERVRYTSDLESYELSLSAVAERIAQLEVLYEQLGASPRDRSTEVAGPTAQAEPEPEPTPHGEVAPPADTAQSMFPEEDGPLDTDALLSVFDRQPDDARGASPVESAPDELPSIEASPLSFTPSRGATNAPPPIGMPPSDPPRFSPPGRPAAPPTPPAASDDPAPMFAGGMVPQVEDDAPQAEATDVVARTVRCGECGAMNRPLEWYCEKCGAELTAM